MNYNTILLSTDLSASCDQVAERAAEMAKKSGGALSIVHVLEHSPVAYGGDFSIPIDVNLEQSLEANARDTLLKLGKKYGVDEKNLFLESGSVKVAVLDRAKKVKADLIVVGSHGHHGVDILLGSRANAVLHGATCDVLSVRVND